eukprot:Polyplicarium_translucidae@DN2838_c0_g1_i2.p1
MKVAAFLTAAAAVIAKGERCVRDIFSGNAVFDVMVVQDVTHSFSSSLFDLETHHLPALFESLNRRGNRMGLVTFTDLPVEGLGAPTDSCTELLVPLTASKEDFTAQLVLQGREVPMETESGQLIALQHALLSPAVGWRPNDYVDPAGRPLIKIVVLVANLNAHTAGDAAAKVPDANFRPNNGDAVMECHVGGEDYPSYDQIRTAFTSQNAVAAVLTTSGVESDLSLHIAENMVAEGHVDDDMWDYVRAIVQTVESIEFCAPEPATTLAEPMTKAEPMTTA